MAAAMPLPCAGFTPRARRARLLERAEGRPYGRLEVRLLGPFEVVVAGSRRTCRGPAAGARSRAWRCARAASSRRTRWSRRCGGAILRRAAKRRAAPRDPAAPGTRAGHRLAADGYALEGAVVDATEFEELLGAARVALRLGDARGAAETITDALSLWAAPRCSVFPSSTWATAEAGRLDALRLDALKRGSKRSSRSAGAAQLVPAIRAALDEPIRERLWGQRCWRCSEAAAGQTRSLPCRRPARSCSRSLPWNRSRTAAPAGGDPRPPTRRCTRPARATKTRQPARSVGPVHRRCRTELAQVWSSCADTDW